ncbi:phage portal protein [Variovorax sp. GT1P44]|uniref:phage portal protein n=1 Tax=Variovorax sp. GT1P44 TaxID=3443742 RepID=UPI003F483C97
MTQTLNLSEKAHTSRVLTEWAASRPGAAKRMGVQNATVVSSNLDGMRDLFQYSPPASGFAVTDKTAMQVSTVFACLSKLSGAILQLPLNKYRFDKDDNRSKAERDDLWWKLNESPAPAWTAASWKEWIVRCVALRGDQHTEILRSRKGATFGEVSGFKVHHPDYVVPRRVGDRLVYDVQDINTSKAYTVDQDDMLHFSGFGFDGLRALSMIQTAAKSGVGNALAAADYTGRSIGEGAMPQIALSWPNAVGPEQAKQTRDSFVDIYGGTGARKMPLVLANGGTVHELSMSPVDMDLLSSRRFEREDICQALGVPPILIGDNDKSSNSYTGIEQITLGFVKYTVKPHLTRWEEEMNRKLFRNAGPFLEFDLDELLRGDSKAQAEADRAALGGAQGPGTKSVNEVRRSHNLPPLKGDEYEKPFVVAKPAAAPASEPAPKEGTQ